MWRFLVFFLLRCFIIFNIFDGREWFDLLLRFRFNRRESELEKLDYIFFF